MAVSKRTRFEVLRRDNFTCRYCRAEDQPLTVDHVLPTALGGTDDPSNLVAACRDCNSGKTSTSPDEGMVANVEDDAVRWAAAMKLAAERADRRMADERQYGEWFLGVWESSMPFAALPPDVEMRQTILRFLSLGLGPEQTVHAIDRAAAASHVYQSARWKYFCGICWSKVRDLQDEARRTLDDGKA